MVIVHASEWLAADEPGFVHAVGMAAHSGASVRGVHIGREPGAQPAPSAAALVERWGHSAAVDHAWLFRDSSEDLVDALLAVITPLRPELIVAYTHARSGVARLFVGSVAEGVARNVAVPMLLLPGEAPPLVNAKTGAFRLDRALLLAGPTSDAQDACTGLSLLTRLAGAQPCAVELLHVEDGTADPQITLPPGFKFTRQHAAGPIERAVAERVQTYQPNLVVMTSHGHDQLSDVVFSSHTERVIHEVRRPVLWIPARHPA